MGIIAGLVAFGLTYALRPRASERAPARAPTVLRTRSATFELHPGAAQLTVASRDGAVRRDLDLAIVVDGTAHPLVLSRDALRAGPDMLRAAVVLALGDETLQARLELRADVARDALAIQVTAPPGPAGVSHVLGLRAELGSEGEVVFVPGVGPIADRATVSGASLVVDADPHPVALMSPSGPIEIDATAQEALAPVQPMHLVASTTAPPGTPAESVPADLRVVLGASSAAVWKTLAELAGVPTSTVRGRVTGGGGSALVLGRDETGTPQVRARTSPAGTFALDVPATVVQWYAAIDAGRASGLVSLVPGTPRELVLDVSPGGDVHVVAVDADTGKPLTVRLLFHGVDGTVDPSFGPDYRASGAGPVIDALRGDVTTPLPSGRYRVAATKGLEWSIDAKIVDVTAGRVTEVQLAPRHVVPTPGVLSCDLHVHARPSFDSPVAPEDRVLSLVAAGVDFAVPTEHNVVGDYTSALQTLELGDQLLSVPGVEVTTTGKGFGHFGVFPWPPSRPVPPFKHTNMAAIFRSVRSGDPARYFQVNHPRLAVPKGIGYFATIGLDDQGPRSRIHNRIDFDGIEVYNGYESERPEQVDAVLRDYWTLLDFGWRFTATGSSDSHRIQFRWAGYPRTMVTVDPTATVDDDTRPVDALTVVANIKKGHAVVTSGPTLELSVAGAAPGDEALTSEEPLHGHLRVRAAPWVDVTRVEVVAGRIDGGYRIVRTYDIPSRPTRTGPEPGTLAEASDRTIRFDADLEIPFGPDNGWVQVVARGERRMDDVLPFMPVPPMAFTNPVYVVRHPAPQPPYPGVPARAP